MRNVTCKTSRQAVQQRLAWLETLISATQGYLKEKQIFAYAVSDLTGYTQVVFTTTRGKAKSFAWSAFDFDCPYTELRVRRMPHLDKFKNTKGFLDWQDNADRLILVKEASFSCLDDDCDCTSCCAKDFCGVYEQIVVTGVASAAQDNRTGL